MPCGGGRGKPPPDSTRVVDETARLVAEPSLMESGSVSGLTEAVRAAIDPSGPATAPHVKMSPVVVTPKPVLVPAAVQAMGVEPSSAAPGPATVGGGDAGELALRVVSPAPDLAGGEDRAGAALTDVDARCGDAAERDGRVRRVRIVVGDGRRA